MNAFQKMLAEKFGFTQQFELALAINLEQILGPADEEKATKLFKTVMDQKNKLLLPEVIAEGEDAVKVYCKALGYFGGVKEMLLKAAEIIKKQNPL